jgi:hypothetical protein
LCYILCFCGFLFHSVHLTGPAALMRTSLAHVRIVSGRLTWFICVKCGLAYTSDGQRAGGRVLLFPLCKRIPPEQTVGSRIMAGRVRYPCTVHATSLAVCISATVNPRAKFHCIRSLLTNLFDMLPTAYSFILAT